VLATRLARWSVYYQPDPAKEAAQALMRRIDDIYLRHPFYGSRQISDEPGTQGRTVSCKQVHHQLMRQMGISALYPRPRTIEPGKGHKVDP
jgi:putative transposase